MNLEFRRGEAARPRGHALAYFDAGDGRVLATYLVVPPIVIDLAKYMPPMFAGQLPTVAPQESAAMPLPPILEEIAGGEAELVRLAELRGDDLLYCGRLGGGQIDQLLIGATEAGQQYAALYRDWMRSAPAEEPPVLDVDEVMLSLMGDHDRIAEIAKLVGKVRYALEVGDPQLQADAIADMERIGRRLPEKYRLAEVTAAAQRPGPDGARLTELHVQRCYKLATEEYAEVARIEAQIREIG